MRLNRVWHLAVLATAAAASSGRAQGLGQVNIHYENALLSRVVQDFETFTGRTIGVGSGINDQLVTIVAQDVAWDVALDQILATKSLVARPHVAGTLQIERERKLSLDYQSTPLNGILQSIAGFAGRRVVLSETVGDPWVTVSIRDTDWQRALDRIASSAGLVARADRDGVFHVEKRP